MRFHAIPTARLFLVAAILAASARLPADDDMPADEAPSEQVQEAFQWFDRLDYPKLEERQFVRIATGWWSQTVGEEPKNSYVYGFLTEDDGRQFKALLLDLSERTFERTDDDVEEHKRVGFARAELKEMVEKQLESLRLLEESGERPAFRRFGEQLSERGELFLLARACDLAGHHQAAKEAIDRALRTPNRITVKKLRTQLEQDISHAEMWRGILDFNDPQIGRPLLLPKFRRIAERFPRSSHAERAKATAELLEKMIAEDKTHASAERKPLDKMTTKERVAELIFQLRDQNGHQWSQPGSCDIFADPRDWGEQAKQGRGSPAAQLVKIGYDAVPQLIESIDDRRFSRSVGYHRNFYFSHHVLRVGDCSLAVLERIAGRSFYRRTHTNAEMLKEGEESATTKAVRQWWGEVEKKGVKQVLIDGIAAGDDNSHRQAMQLLKQDPEATLEAIGRGVQAASNEWVQTSLIQVAATIKGDGPLELLGKQMSQAPSLATRVAAATGLLKRRRRSAVPAMIAQWKKFRERNDEDKKAGRRGESGVEELIGFLAGCNEVAAIEALASGFSEHPVHLRIAVVSEFSSNYSFSKFAAEGGLSRGDGLPQPKPEVVAAIQRLLIAALEDLEEQEGMSGSWNGKSYEDPRVCDMAGHVLNLQAPREFVFDLGADRFERDRQRIAIINAWRKEQGQPQLPTPRKSQIKRLPKEATQPLLDAVVAAGDETSRRRAVDAYLERGLPALPALLEWLASRPADAPENDPAAAAVRRLASQVACIVSEVKWDRNSVKPYDGMKLRIQSLLDRPLTSSAFVQAMLVAARGLPDGAVGVRLLIERPRDGTGVVLTVTFLKQRPANRGSSSGFSSNTKVRAGSRSLHNSSSSGVLSHFLNTDSHEDLAGALDEALSSPHDVPLVARVTAYFDD